MIFLTPIRLLWRIGEGGIRRAYYPALCAIWNDDTSIKNGSPVQLIQRMNPESGLTKTIQATSRKRLKCSWRPLPNPDAVLSGTLVKSTLRGQIRSCLWYCGKGEHTESRKAYHVEVRRWDAWRKYVGVLLQSQMVGTRIPVTDIRSIMFLRRLSTVYQ